MSVAVALFDAWLRVALGSFLLLAVASAAVLVIRQPARRIRVIQWTLAGLVVLPLLVALPSYPRLAILPRLADVLQNERDTEQSEAEPAPPSSDVLPPTLPAEQFLEMPIEPTEFEPAPWVPQPAPIEWLVDEAPTDEQVVAPQPRVLVEPIHVATAPETIDSYTTTEPLALAKESVPIVESHQPNSPWLPQDYRAWLLAAYGTGVLAMVAWSYLGLLAVWRLMRSAREAPLECRVLLRSLGGPRSDRVALVVSPRVQQPCALRWRRTTIVLPQSLVDSALVAQADPQALRWALAHEWSHVERRDLVAWNVSGLLRWFYFYQPLVWWLRGQLQLCQDFVADAAAARWGEMPEDYAEFLTTSSFTRPTLAAGLGIGGRISDLRRRVIMLVERHRPLENKSPRVWNLAMMPIAILLVALAASLAPSGNRLEAGDGRPEEAGQGSAAEPAEESSAPVESTAPAEAAEPTTAPVVATPAPAAQPAVVTETKKAGDQEVKPARPVKAPSAPIARQPTSPRKIQPGDMLTIEVQDNIESLNFRGLKLLLRSGTTAAVDADGRLSLGSSYGEVDVEGKTLRDAERGIADQLTSLVKLRIARARQSSTVYGDPEYTRNNLEINVRLSFVNTNAPYVPYVPSQTFLPAKPAATPISIAPAPVPPQAPAADRTRRIESGDRLHITIKLNNNGTWRDAAYVLLVQPNGTISPSPAGAKYEPCIVVGYTAEALEQHFARAIEEAEKMAAKVSISVYPRTSESSPKVSNIKPGVVTYSQPAPPPVSTLSTRIQPGDRVSVEARFEPVGNSRRFLVQSYTVDPDGLIAMGAEYGRCKLGGLTVEEAEQALIKKLSEFGPGVKVQIDRYSNPSNWPRVQTYPAPVTGTPTVEPYVHTIQQSPSTQHATIQPGDALHIEVLPEEANKLIKTLSVVEADGMLALGVTFGRVKVAGLSLSDAEALVKDIVGKSYRDPEVQITHADATNVPPSFGLPIIPESGEEASHVEALQQEITKLKATIRTHESAKASSPASQPYSAPPGSDSQPNISPPYQNEFHGPNGKGPVGPLDFEGRSSLQQDENPYAAEPSAEAKESERPRDEEK